MPAGVPALRTPAWNSTGRDEKNHVDWVTSNGPISTHEARDFDESNTLRWRTLLSVDDLVDAVIASLRALDLLHTTYVMYSSDNGYHLGHMRLPDGKNHFYEFDSRVPFLVRGPGVAAGTTPLRLAGNVDLAPTLLTLAGFNPTRDAPQMDGRSILAWLLEGTVTTNKDIVLEHSGVLDDVGVEDGAGSTSTRVAAAEAAPWRSAFLLEFSGLKEWPTHAGTRINDCPNNTWRALRIVDRAGQDEGVRRNWLYAEWTTVADYYYEDVRWHEL